MGGGVEHDLSYQLDSFALRSEFGSSSYVSNIKPRETRYNGNVGLGFKVGSEHLITLDGTINQSPYGSQADYTRMFGFKAGF